VKVLQRPMNYKLYHCEIKCDDLGGMYKAGKNLNKLVKKYGISGGMSYGVGEVSFSVMKASADETLNLLHQMARFLKLSEYVISLIDWDE